MLIIEKTVVYDTFSFELPIFPPSWAVCVNFANSFRAFRNTYTISTTLNSTCAIRMMYPSTLLPSTSCMLRTVLPMYVLMHWVGIRPREEPTRNRQYVMFVT